MAKDFYHDNVRIALENDHWLITHDPVSYTHLDVYKRQNSVSMRMMSFSPSVSFIVRLLVSLHLFLLCVRQLLYYRGKTLNLVVDALAVTLLVFKGFGFGQSFDISPEVVAQYRRTVGVQIGEVTSPLK